MTIPAFQFWRLRVTSIEAGDLLKIDSMAFLGRSGGDNIATGGTALSDAGDASGAFTGGSAWRVGFGSVPQVDFAITTYLGSPPKGLEIYNADTDALITSLYPTQPSGVSPKNAQFSPDGTKLVVSYIDAGASLLRYRIYNTSDYSEYSTGAYGPTFPSDTNGTMRISPNGEFLGLARRILNFPSLSVALTMTRDYYDIAFSPDSAYAVLVRTYGTAPLVLIYDTATWSSVSLTLSSSISSASSCDFSPDGTILRISAAVATASVDTIINIDTATWTEIDSFQVTDMTAIEKIRHSNSGQYLAITSSGGTASTIMPIDVYDVSASPPSRVAITSSLPPLVETTAAPTWRGDDSEILVPIDILSGIVTDHLYRVDTSTWTISGILTGNREYYSADYSPTFTEGSWIGYKFSYPVTPTHIDITASGDSRPRSGVIEYSPDGRTWYALQTIAFS